jgi:hypothetical protein
LINYFEICESFIFIFCFILKPSSWNNVPPQYYNRPPRASWAKLAASPSSSKPKNAWAKSVTSNSWDNTPQDSSSWETPKDTTSSWENTSQDINSWEVPPQESLSWEPVRKKKNKK